MNTETNNIEKSTRAPLTDGKTLPLTSFREQVVEILGDKIKSIHCGLFDTPTIRADWNLNGPVLQIIVPLPSLEGGSATFVNKFTVVIHSSSFDIPLHTPDKDVVDKWYKWYRTLANEDAPETISIEWMMDFALRYARTQKELSTNELLLQIDGKHYQGVFECVFRNEFKNEWKQCSFPVPKLGKPMTDTPLTEITAEYESSLPITVYRFPAPKRGLTVQFRGKFFKKDDYVYYPYNHEYNLWIVAAAIHLVQLLPEMGSAAVIPPEYCSRSLFVFLQECNYYVVTFGEQYLIVKPRNCWN